MGKFQYDTNERRGPWYVTVSVTVATTIPAVTATRSVPPMPSTVLPQMVVSAIHSVASVAVKPSLMATLLSDVAKSTPVTVISAAPVDGMLPPPPTSAKAGRGSYEIISVIVPAL